jgi:predicted permease
MMRRLRAVWVRACGLFGQARREREMAEEMASHLAMQIAENQRAGMTPQQARRDALLRSGGLDQAKEACRDRRSLPVIETLLRDLRHTARGLGRSPAFTTVAVLSLALGIGANTAIFTLLDQLALRLLPVRSPEQLTLVWVSNPDEGVSRRSKSVSYPMYQDLQRSAAPFAEFFCRHDAALAVAVDAHTERVEGELVSGNYFRALGVGAAVGRVFSSEQDDRIYLGHSSVVLSHSYWVARFGADPGAVGKKILVNNYPMTIVGVSAAGFHGIDPALSPQIRVPIQMKPLMTPGWDDLNNRRSRWLHAFARMKPGYTVQSVQAALQPLVSQVLRVEADEPALRDLPKNARDQFLARRAVVEPAASGYSEIRRDYGTALTALMAMVGLVLLIACFNVASLLIARAAARQKEVAVRLAIGASRGQLVRQLLIESLCLSGLGAALGVALSATLIRWILSLTPPQDATIALRADPDWRILAFSAGLALLTSLLFGLAPAWQSVRLSLFDSLKDVAGSVSGSRGSVRLRKVLVTAQVALSFLLLAGAGLFVKSLMNLKRTDCGFERIESLVTFQVDAELSGYSRSRAKALYSRALESVRAIPGVKSASYAGTALLAGSGWDTTVAIEGYRPREGDPATAFLNCVSPEHWRTMGVPLLEGRDFTGRDAGERIKAAIVSRSFARRYFGNASPIGRHIGLGGRQRDHLTIEIVGVVGDSLYEGPRQGIPYQVIVPYAQMPMSVPAVFYVRASGDVTAALRRKIQELDPALPVFEMKTLERQLDETLSTERLIAAFSAGFGALATLLAAVGLYGVLALTVARRTREIGLRMALGARRSAVLWMVMRDAVWLLAAGLTVGVPCAWALTRLVASQLFGVEPADPGTALAAMAILAGAAILAGLPPARRASAIDPIRALRHE